MNNTQKILAEIYKHVYVEKKDWPCACKGCAEKAINSHLLQHHGMLNEISDDHHLMMVKPMDMFRLTKDKAPVEFKKIGLNNAISIHLFCNQHDTELFSEIEQQPLDVNLYKHQMLLFKRCLYSEKRLKEYSLEYYSRISKSIMLPSSFTENAQAIIHQTKLGINDLEKQINIVDSEIEKESHSFDVMVKEFPLIPIVVASSFSVGTMEELSEATSKIEGIYFLLFPYNGHAVVILGMNSEKTTNMKRIYDAWNNVDENGLGRLLTNMFVNHIEMWGMSTRLYYSISQEDIKKFYHKIGEAIESPTPIDAGFDMFNFFKTTNIYAQ